MELPKLFDYTSPTQTLSVYVFIANISFSTRGQVFQGNIDKARGSHKFK